MTGFPVSQARLEAALRLTGYAALGMLLTHSEFQWAPLLLGGHRAFVRIKCGEARPRTCVQEKPAGEARSSSVLPSP